jgi:hypothetical protein
MVAEAFAGWRLLGKWAACGWFGEAIIFAGILMIA